MVYEKIQTDDIANGEGVSVSIWFRGCPHKCKGCHNPDLWDYDIGGTFEDDNAFFKKLSEAITKNGITRNVSFLGGEPLFHKNLPSLFKILKYLKENHPQSKIWLWTGYTLEEIKDKEDYHSKVLEYIDVLIDGPYIEKLRDVTLPHRGSSNQRILKKEVDF